VSFFAYAPGPDLASNAVVFKMSLRNNKTIILYTRKFAPGQALQI